nr:hypothetical protein [Tanacetum cinerariifolium]
MTVMIRDDRYWHTMPGDNFFDVQPYEIQSIFASITLNDQGFTVDRNVDDFLVTENFGMILGQPVHTNDNVKTTEFNWHEINFESQMVKFVFHLLDLDPGTILLYQKFLEFNPGASLGSGFLLALSAFAMVATCVFRVMTTLSTTSYLMEA